jgi:hypothetical protein
VNGWSFGNTSYFKKGKREPDLGRGVPDERFTEFFSVIAQKAKGGANAVLVLSGHTHHSVEYYANWMDDKIAFWHDYYLDGTVEGESQSQYWAKTLNDYSTPLNKSASPKEWWQRHSPLFVQTLSVTIPSSSSAAKGVRYITVEDRLIAQIEQGELPFEGKGTASSSNQAYFILASSPP